MADYVPERCSVFALYPERCFLGDSPTLADFKQIHGSKWMTLWVENQLRAIGEYTGVREKFTTEQLQDTASAIFTEYYYFKMAELMLFFHRFKSGRYGRFYGSADPMVLTEALCKFKVERAAAIDNYHQQAAMRARTTEDRTGTISINEWRTIKRQLSNVLESLRIHASCASTSTSVD